jgi:hypothetical protein
MNALLYWSLFAHPFRLSAARPLVYTFSHSIRFTAHSAKMTTIGLDSIPTWPIYFEQVLNGTSKHTNTSNCSFVLLGNRHRFAFMAYCVVVLIPPVRLGRIIFFIKLLYLVVVVVEFCYTVYTNTFHVIPEIKYFTPLIFYYVFSCVCVCVCVCVCAVVHETSKWWTAVYAIWFIGRSASRVK